ncbi:MAG: fimbrial protein [Shewanella sp.]
MKTIKQTIVRCLGLLSLSLLSCTSWAVIDCRFQTGSVARSDIMPLLKSSITVGRDAPLGTILYRQTYQTIIIQTICSNDGTVSLQRGYGHHPKPKSTWASSPWANAVYETGVPGIGIVFWFSGVAFPNSSTYNHAPAPGVSTIYSWQNHLAFDMDLIKIGPVSPGVIRSIDLPSAIVDFQDSSPKRFNMVTVNLSGDIAVVSQTCQTPDVNVVLGTHSIEPLVAGTSNETPRKNFSVMMQNCPVFYGKGELNAKPIWHPIDGVRQYNEVPNDIKISFTPKHGVLDSNAMIAKLDPVQPGNAPAAQGIGIALYDPSGTRYKFDGHFVNVATPAIGSSADITIPLQAAYTFDTAKPKSDIKPGYGNAAIEFTIQYN